jgi:hypothetical protein
MLPNYGELEELIFANFSPKKKPDYNSNLIPFGLPQKQNPTTWF